MIALWTAIIDFRGVTYVRQARAPSPHAALPAVLATLSPGEIRGLGASRLRQAMEEARGILSEPVAIQGTRGVYCTGALPGGLSLVNVVATAPSSSVARRRRARWTCVIDFRGGTYIRQISAALPRKALLRALRKTADDVWGLTSKAKARLLEHASTRSGAPVAVPRLHSVYGTSIRVGRHTMAAHVIETDGDVRTSVRARPASGRRSRGST